MESNAAMKEIKGYAQRLRVLALHAIHWDRRDIEREARDIANAIEGMGGEGVQKCSSDPPDFRQGPIHTD